MKFLIFIISYSFCFINFSFGLNIFNTQDYPTVKLESGNTLEPKRVFLTFGGNSPGYHKRVISLCNQANQMEFFTHIFGFTEKDLKCDPIFWNRHANFIENNARGYGYWLWKPYLIKVVLDQLNENDILVYADAGCTLNPQGLPRLNEYVQMLYNSDFGIISFQMNYWLEIRWTKKLLIDYLDMNNSAYLNSGQCIATAIIFKKCAHSSEIVNQWYEIGSNYNLINDNTSAHENSGFTEHRHDQSIYSLLVKKYGSIKIHDEIHSRNISLPIWATKIRG